MYRILYGIIYVIFAQSTSARTFKSRDALVRGIIQGCVQTTPAGTTRSRCTLTLACILRDVPQDYTARWSAGASILAFIPTIVGLMSNSVEEIGLIAEDSPVLAILLSLSSVTAFSTRFAGSSTGNGVFEHHTAYVEAACGQIKRLLEHSESGGKSARQWQRYHTVLVLLAELMLVLLGALDWYCIWALGNWGVVVFSCPWSMHAAIWVGLRQVVAITDILLRRYYHDIKTVSLKRSAQMTTQARKKPRNGFSLKRLVPFREQLSELKEIFIFVYKLISPMPSDDFIVILRSPRSDAVSWVLKTWSAVLNTGLYTTGTVVLASIVMVPASDAIRVMVVLTGSAGFGRLVGAWILSSSTRGRKSLIMDVPAAQMQAVAERLEQENIDLSSMPTGI